MLARCTAAVLQPNKDREALSGHPAPPDERLLDY